VGPVLIGDWKDHENITAIVWAGLPGQESGNAIVDVLYGDVNPAGKSPFSWARHREDYGTDVLYQPNGDVPQSDFTEGVFTDYRALDRSGVEPLFEFGYGLSYTTFEYSGLKVEKIKGARSYGPTIGFTGPAPLSQSIRHEYEASDRQQVLMMTSANTSLDWGQYTFPEGFVQEEAYIYPWLDNASPNVAAKSTDYGDGNVDFIPRGSHDAQQQPLLPAGGGPGGNPALYDVLYTVSASIKNTGDLAGDEVVQIVSPKLTRGVLLFYLAVIDDTLC